MIKNKRRPSLDGKNREKEKKQRTKDVITSASVFSMGPADRPIAGRTGSMKIIPQAKNYSHHSGYHLLG